MLVTAINKCSEISEHFKNSKKLQITKFLVPYNESFKF